MCGVTSFNEPLRGNDVPLRQVNGLRAGHRHRLSQLFHALDESGDRRAVSVLHDLCVYIDLDGHRIDGAGFQTGQVR